MLFHIGSTVPASTSKTARRLRPIYIALSLLLVAPLFVAFAPKAAATYPDDNGQIIAGEGNQLVAFDPNTFDKQVLESFASGSYVFIASADSSGVDIAYLLQTPASTVELHLYNRQTQSDRLVQTYADIYELGGAISLSPNAGYAALTYTDNSGNYSLYIVRMSDGTTTAQYNDALAGIGWNSVGTEVLATNQTSDTTANNFAWFSVDGSSRTVVIPNSDLPSGKQVVATSLSPDKQHILYTTIEATNQVPLTAIGEIDIDGTNDHQLLNGSPTEAFLYGAFSPDGQRFAYVHVTAATGSGQFSTRAINGDPATETDSSFGQGFIIVSWAPSVTATPDTTPPVVTGTPDRSPNANGWYNSDVTIDWQAVDPDPSSGTPTDPANTTANQEGKDVTYTSDPSCDPAGNCATGTLQLSIDKTAPTGSLTDSALVLRLLGGNIGGTAGDGLSGVDEVKVTQGTHTWSSKTGGITLAYNAAKTSCTWSIASPSSLPLGLLTYTLTVTDAAGNTTTATKAYTVI